jgi:hypothetical protein
MCVFIIQSFKKGIYGFQFQIEFFLLCHFKVTTEKIVENQKKIFNYHSNFKDERFFLKWMKIQLEKKKIAARLMTRLKSYPRKISLHFTFLVKIHSIEK